MSEDRTEEQVKADQRWRRLADEQEAAKKSGEKK